MLDLTLRRAMYVCNESNDSNEYNDSKESKESIYAAEIYADTHKHKFAFQSLSTEDPVSKILNFTKFRSYFKFLSMDLKIIL